MINLIDKLKYRRILTMKKFIAIALTFVLMLSLAACGGGGTPASPQANTATNPPAAGNTNTAAPANTSTPDPAPQPQGGSSGIKAEGGTITASANDIAVVINGNSVAMPYNIQDLEAAGVPKDESRNDIKLGAGDFFSANLYLDENEDYLLIPAYYNGGDSEISITKAKAEEIMMTTYADEPKDQGVSIFGVTFGMPRSEVKTLLGEPTSDDGDYDEWHVEVPDLKYEGTLSMYFTKDADDAGVSQVDLTVFAK